MIRRFQRHRIDSRPIALSGNPGKKKPIMHWLNSAVQQNNRGPILPTFAAAIEPSIYDVVLREFAGSRRGETKMQRVIELNFRRPGFGRNEVRPVQELDSFFQLHNRPRFPQGLWEKCPVNLKDRPVNKLCQWRDHARLCGQRARQTVTVVNAGSRVTFKVRSAVSKLEDRSGRR